ncbi:DinB family protein [Paenibacillus chondroitinus]|uniref:DinB family protein n=1 Tax=Paenibacillus chondroitinus TaxID=59842 RepID=A0ABU6DBW3_9BACL|nr:DinB family protein [Paenibacillus chondroitinus]MCY9656424.1 DinB family protein [Paenibacillus anseongense]MEB4795248.1 DinB family protein [Paenibacillus chondroitinus]
MKTIKPTLESLNHWITELPSKIDALSELALSERTQPNKWSIKEILGHLSDSALNNLHRFVSAQYEVQPCTAVKYAQNHWVELMDYQNLPIEHILNLWLSLNKQIATVIAKIPEDKLQNSCDLGEEQIVTLEWIIKDYVDHLEHHLKQISHSLENPNSER